MNKRLHFGGYKNDSQLNPENSERDTLLEYKDHREFFNKFYEFRTIVIYKMSEQQLKYSREGIKELFVAINNIIEWTSEYINITKIDKEIEDIDILITKIHLVKEEKIEEYIGNIFKSIKKIWRFISQEHSRYELIPKIQVEEEEEDPFKDETSKQKLLMYKVVRKLFENV